MGCIATKTTAPRRALETNTSYNPNNIGNQRSLQPEAFLYKLSDITPGDRDHQKNENDKANRIKARYPDGFNR